MISRHPAPRRRPRPAVTRRSGLPVARTRPALPAVAVALILLACGCGGNQADVTGGTNGTGGGAATTAPGGSAPIGPDVPLGPAASSDVPPDTSGAQLTPEQLAGVTDAYLRFVTLADRAGVGDPAAGQALATAADQGVIDVIDNSRRANEQLKGQDAGVQARTSTANMATITGTPEAVVIADCLASTASHDVLYLRPVQFVDRLTTLRLDGEQWKVARVEVRNDGTLGSGRTTSCAPLADSQRLSTTVTDLMTALDQLWTDPSQQPPASVTDHVDESFVAEITAGQAQAAAAGQYLAAPTEHRVSVLGSDLTAGGPNWVVGVCTLYPEGLTPLSKATGQPAGLAILAPGAQVYREFGVRSEPVDGGSGLVDRIYEGRRVDTASTCGDRS